MDGGGDPGRGPLEIPGVPTGAPPWRARVADAACGQRPAGDGLVLHFTVRPRQFVDLDTLVQTALAGLRDAGVYRRGFPGLDVILAAKAIGPETGLRTESAEAAVIAGREPPGPMLLDVHAAALPGSGREGKRAWREAIGAAWGSRATVPGEAWADVALRVSGSVLGPLEPILDALEPALGRDPRGRSWQEFFPADDRITWLRVRREQAADAPVLGLRLGTVGTSPR